MSKNIEINNPSEYLHKIAEKVAGRYIQRLLGFWMMWHAYGGFEGLQKSGILSRANIYKQRSEFLLVFKIDVEEFLPEYGSKFHRTADKSDE